jgi:DNA-directed RNA polymerase subunit RPC12/RpoP
MAKWKLRIQDQRVVELMLHELPKNGDALCRISAMNAPLFTVFGTYLPIGFWKDLTLDRRIDWDFLSRSVSSDVSSCIVKNIDETVLHDWIGTRVVHKTTVVGGNAVQTSTLQSGILVLTNQRLIWLERRQTGFWKPTVSFLPVFEIPLQDIKGISGGTGDSSKWQIPVKVSLVDAHSENVFDLQYAFLEVLKSAVENAIEMRKKEMDADRKKDRLHVMLDFSFLKTYLEKGGMTMQVLKCPECGAKIEFPKSGAETKCSHCGNTIYAQDIFEKVKNLLE